MGRIRYMVFNLVQENVSMLMLQENIVITPCSRLRENMVITHVQTLQKLHVIRLLPMFKPQENMVITYVQVASLMEIWLLPCSSLRKMLLLL